jgi:hypothetical protein
MQETAQYMTIKEASKWASDYIGKEVTISNISYLIQYGRIPKVGHNGSTQVLKSELANYYNSINKSKEMVWKEKLGGDLNWALSFDKYKEVETTKHVHRLHPYKGKFIPQLVEYFLDSHTDKFKIQTYFKRGAVVLDPFCGSGTTLAQANELGIHALGIDVSSFNAFISNCKIANYDIGKLEEEIAKITEKLNGEVKKSGVDNFEKKLLEELKRFNDKYFPAPEFKYKLRQNLINEHEYGAEKERQFLPIYKRLIAEYKIELLKNNPKTFLEKWCFKNIRKELDFVFNEIKRVKDADIKKILALILSRAMRSCRATTHSDLATLIKPVDTTYYCSKHGKVCKPIFSIMKWWLAYSKDTAKRLKEFDKLKTDTCQHCLTGDGRTINIYRGLSKEKKDFAQILQKQKIAGIFSSPPYVGLIDYHEQHAYAYDLFGFKRNDALEIGPLFKGQGKEAQKSYAEGVSAVLNNCKKYLQDDYDVFLVANDKYNLYPEIAEKSGMKIVNQFKRPVLNRTEKDKGAYSETIFHLKDKSNGS